MGFAYEDGTGIPGIAAPASSDQWEPVPPPQPLALHVQPEPVPSPEVQIGDIMLKVQRFAEETAEDARRQARAVLAEAQVEAASIVSRARREAEEISGQATPQIAPEAVTNLCSAIEEFATTNRVLVDELVQLRQALAGSYAATPISPSGHLSALPPTAG
jgi:hypothetical protein